MVGNATLDKFHDFRKKEVISILNNQYTGLQTNCYIIQGNSKES